MRVRHFLRLPRYYVLEGDGFPRAVARPQFMTRSKTD